MKELPPIPKTFQSAVLMSLHQTGTDETKQRELFCTSVSSASAAKRAIRRSFAATDGATGAGR